MTVYSVALYLIDKAYGGSEEGGWWYTYGYPVDLDRALELTPEFWQPLFFTDEDEAYEYARLCAPVEDELNSGRRSIDSVLSEGRYSFEVCEGLPKPFPEERPHYE